MGNRQNTETQHQQKQKMKTQRSIISNNRDAGRNNTFMKLQSNISTISEQDKEILLTISKNILDNTQESKYRSINKHTLSGKCISDKCSINLLICAGFKICDNGKRLILEENDISKMQILFILLSPEDQQHKMAGTMGITMNVVEPTKIKSPYQDHQGCAGSVSQCPDLLLIKKTFAKDNSCNNYTSLDIVLILNSFHHLLREHDSDEQFEEIYASLGQCDISKCNGVKRNQRERDVEENKIDFIDDILDKIHCYFQHSQDVGLRLTKNTRKQIEIIDEEQKYDNGLSIKKLLDKFKPKKSEQKHIKPFSGNKFNAYFDTTNDKYESFNYGESYVYWPWKFSFDVRTKEEDYNKSYIWPKYKSLKDELTQNRFAQITPKQWNNEYKKADVHKQCIRARKLVAQFPYNGRNGTSDSGTFLTDYHIYGIDEGKTVETKHLIAVMIYCNYGALSYAFSKTYRRLDKDDFSDDDYVQYVEEKSAYQQNTNFARDVFVRQEMFTGNEGQASMKGRHGKFHHLAKCLNELIHVFSPQVLKLDITNNDPFKLYHGISKKMKFIAMRDFIRHPLSTTSSLPVAINFTDHNNGMVLELNCDPVSRMFDCAWISDFVGEAEKLFVNAVFPFIFRNIIDPSTMHGIQYYESYIKALSIINSVIMACDFEPSTMLIRDAFLNLGQDIKNLMNLTKSNLQALGAQPISDKLKTLTVRLIHNELHLYQPQKYGKMKNIPVYIEELLHYMCTTWTFITIDWELMIVEIKDTYGPSGYNGYCF